MNIRERRLTLQKKKHDSNCKYGQVTHLLLKRKIQRREKQMRKMRVLGRTIKRKDEKNGLLPRNSPRNKDGEDGKKELIKDGRLEGKGPDFYTSSKTEFFVKGT